MMKRHLSLTAAVAVLAVSSIGYANAADVAKGKKVFNKCKACHTLVAGKHRIEDFDAWMAEQARLHEEGSSSPSGLSSP